MGQCVCVAISVYVWDVVYLCAAVIRTFIGVLALAVFFFLSIAFCPSLAVE